MQPPNTTSFPAPGTGPLPMRPPAPPGGGGEFNAAASCRPAPLVRDGITSNGWTISTVKGPIIADRDVDAFRQSLESEGVFSLPEMLFNQSLVTLTHEASGVTISLNAHDALKQWRQEGLPAVQVSTAKAWQSARQQEIAQQKAVQLQYDWTYTTPFCGTVLRRDSGAVQPATVQPPAQAVGGEGATSGGKDATVGDARPEEAAAAQAGSTGVPVWEETKEQIDKGLLMERDPILFFDEVPLYESDLDDNGVCQFIVKLRVMPKCWLVLLRLWIRVDGCMVRLRETRLFCRTDLPATRGTVLREQKHVEGTFKQLRNWGAPDEGPAYADADAASAAFQAVAPIGVKLFKLEKMQVE